MQAMPEPERVKRPEWKQMMSQAQHWAQLSGQHWMLLRPQAWCRLVFLFWRHRQNQRIPRWQAFFRL